MPKDDADMIDYLFSKSDSANYLVVDRFTLSDGNTTIVEIIADSTLHIWYLAKTVEMFQSHEKRMNEAIENCKNKVANDRLQQG